jgi:GMP synthase (glutamine-hydrolysing)
VIERPVGNIWVLQHHPCEVLGTIETALLEADLGYRYVRGFDDEPIPGEMDDADGLVVLGGPLSVNAQGQYPFLRAEIALIRSALAADKPVLGVCLGSQLLASALGARVFHGERTEIGWLPVYLSDAAANDRLFRGAPASFVTCIWHGDVFDLPAGATSLAYSDKTPCQAFRYGEAAYGLLFHLEVTPEIVSCAVDTFAAQIKAAGLDKEQCIREGHRYVPAAQALGRQVFARWAALCRSLRP